jgi:nucleotide-binding universal stress UspA family protein
MKTILVPVDFSACADNALTYAVQLALKANAEIILLHVSMPDHGLNSHQRLIRENPESPQKELFKRLWDIRDGTITDYRVRIRTDLYESHDIPGCIRYVAKYENADLIVMGTEGANTVHKKIFGSKAAAIINISHVPVLTIPPLYKWTEPLSILLAIEEKNQDPAFFIPVSDLAALFNAHIFVAIFTDENSEALDVLKHSRDLDVTERSLAKSWKNLSVESVHMSGRHFEASIQDFIKQKNINLLVMITHERNFLEKIFDNSLTQQMAYHVMIPLLSFHKNDEK